MSSYCLLEEALALVPFIGNITDVPATDPSYTQAESFISLVSAEIDQHLAAMGEELPIEDDTALAALKTIACYGVASLVVKAAFPSDQGYGGQNGSAGFYETKYQTALGYIDRGELITSAPTPTSGFSHGFESAAEKLAEKVPF